jgi:hypothetical protein
LQDDETMETFTTTSDIKFCDFVNKCSSYLNSNNFQIIVTITKNTSEQRKSVYYPNRFFDNLSKKSIDHFLEIINNVLGDNDFIIFEVQNNSFEDFFTSTIKFTSKEKQVTYNNINREKINKIKNLCHCNIISKYQFIPEDFYPIKKNETLLDIIFSKISVLYSAIFLFDIFDINGTNIEYRLNGYKTITEKLIFSDIEIASYQNFYEIYSWVYEGGNIVDKIGLARNILSLNLENKNLKIAETTFEAVKSGYKIYQKENIKQYIEVRNKISDQLIELQNRADKIVENFVNDYKKSFLAIISFFITVVVIGVVSKDNFASAFTAKETSLLMGFLFISSYVRFFAKKEINKQIDIYAKFYKNLKERHQDLLDKSDINRILNNDEDFNNNMQFIKERRDDYTKLWNRSLIILLVISYILYFINNFNFCQLIKGVLCCIGNILQ